MALARRVALLQIIDRFILELSEEMRFTSENHTLIINNLMLKENFKPLLQLKKDSIEATFLVDFTNGLGKSDMQGQLSYCSAARLRLKSIINNANKECESKSKLYRILGVILGAMFTVLIV